MALSSMLLTMAMNYSGASPLHSFAGSSGLGLFLTIPALLFMSYGLYGLLGIRTSRDPLSVGMLMATGALLIASLYVFFTLMIPVAASLLGMRLPIPAYDSAIAIYYPVLLPCTLLLMGGVGIAGFSRVGRGLAFSLSWIAASLFISTLLVGLGLRWSPVSSDVVNTYILAFLLATPIMLWGIVRLFRLGIGLGLTHLGLLMLIVSTALSGPYAYNASYFNFASLKPGSETIVPLPNVGPLGPGYVEVGLVAERIEVSDNMITLPPPLVGRYVPKDLPDYVTYLSALNALSSNGFRIVMIHLDNGDYLSVVNSTLGEHDLGEWRLIVNSTESTGGEDFVVGFMEFQGYRLTLPMELTSTLKLALDTLNCTPKPLLNNEALDHLSLRINGQDAQATYRFDASGLLGGIGGSVPAVAVVSSGLGNYYVVASPGGSGNSTAPILDLARYNLGSCNVVGSWILLSMVSGVPLSAGEFLRAINTTGESTVLVLVKYIPMVNLVWLSAITMVVGTAAGAIPRLRNASVFQ
jgi:cytochrome c-type biogenesis protein CcmF